ncbi:MAG: M1 family metallopeptidase [Bacteroidetes bacterium]|nr:M1 family metallopeptidase [Bacteroidota bacterium]
MKKNKSLSFLFFVCNLITSGQNYFQQDVKYSIHVKLNDVTHELSAFENIEYTNNSPDVLSTLYFHVWPNAYKDNNTALAKQLLESGKTFFYYSQDSLKGYIDSLDFKINDKAVKWEFEKNNIDICVITLNEPLKSGQSITITTPFYVKIPDAHISLLGHEGQSYQISQWFPKPAVYGTNGWNTMPYLDQGEFYSEYGSFDVYITLPENYVVGATGDLVDNEKESAWLDSIAIATSQLKSFDNNDLAFPLSSKQTKTLHYHQEKVHDFAWFADKRYHVLKGEVELPVSKRKVNTYVMFTNNEADLWKNSIEYVNDAIFYYSKWIGEYPYKHATAVEGASFIDGGSMEYPNITVVSSAGDSASLEMLIIHEVGHNWFYGILGSNERKFPWMDEGINSFYEYRTLQTKHPGNLVFFNQFKNIIYLPEHAERSERSLVYDIASHLNNDQPVGSSSEIYSTLNYNGIVYEKSAVALAFLKDYIGEEKFDNAMRDYFIKWKFRHPQPENLITIRYKSCWKI